MWVEDKFFSRQESNHVYTVRVHQFNNWLNVFFVFYVTTSHQLHPFTASCLKVQLNNFFFGVSEKMRNFTQDRGLAVPHLGSYWYEKGVLTTGKRCLLFTFHESSAYKHKCHWEQSVQNISSWFKRRPDTKNRRLAATKFIHLNTSARPCYKNVVNKLCSI